MYRGSANDPGDTPSSLRHHFDPRVDALFEFTDVGDDADQTSSLPEFHEYLQSLVQCFRVQRAKALVDEQRFQTQSSSMVLDDIREPESE